MCSFFLQYWERKVKFSDYYLSQGCDDSCLKKALCDIVTMVHGDDRKCDELIQLYHNSN